MGEANIPAIVVILAVMTGCFTVMYFARPDRDTPMWRQMKDAWVDLFFRR